MKSGGKDLVSIGNNVHEQKRLLLSNLKELYAAYKKRYPYHKMGLSNFYKLHPKRCVTVLSGTLLFVFVLTIKTPNYLLTVALL